MPSRLNHLQKFVPTRREGGSIIEKVSDSIIIFVFLTPIDQYIAVDVGRYKWLSEIAFFEIKCTFCGRKENTISFLRQGKIF